jgi:cell wall-associated NlpC family hydrolase
MTPLPASIAKSPIRLRPVTPTRATASVSPPAPAKAPASLAATAVARPATPPDSLWYRFKRAAANVLFNLPMPSLTARTLGQGVPEGLLSTMKPGDVLLRRTEGTSGNLAIPSWWKHAAVYLGDGKVAEATFEGVHISTMEEFFAGGDHVAVLSPKGLTDAQRQKTAAFARAQVGKPYDFNVDFSDDARFMCTELVATALRQGVGKPLVELGKWTKSVVGDDFFNGRFDTVYSSAPERNGT